MLRRNFLALLGLAPAALALPRVASAAVEAECPPSAINAAVRASMASIAAGWRYEGDASVWIHSDGRFVTNSTLAETGIATAEEYCQRYNVKFVRRAGDYNVLSNGSAMHSGFPERITWRRA